MKGKAMPEVLPLPKIWVYEAGFSYPSTEVTYYEGWNAEADMRFHLSSIKPDIKEIYKI